MGWSILVELWYFFLFFVFFLDFFLFFFGVDVACSLGARWSWQYWYRVMVAVHGVLLTDMAVGVSFSGCLSVWLDGVGSIGIV